MLTAPTVLFILLKGREHKIIINNRCSNPHRNGTFDGTAFIKAATKEERVVASAGRDSAVNPLEKRLFSKHIHIEGISMT